MTPQFSPEVELLKLPRGVNRKENARVYYYQGNFYHPLSLFGDEPGKVRKAIRDFIKQNQKAFKADRTNPEYKTLVEIFDEAFQ